MAKNMQLLDQLAHRTSVRRDRRAWRRIPLHLPVKMLARGRHEIEAETLDISGGGMLISSPKVFHPGEELICYIEQIGRLPAKVVRNDEDRLGLEITATPQKRDRLVDQITWLWNKDRLGLEEDRRSNRRPAEGRLMVTFEDGRAIQADVIDMSVVGVALAAPNARPRIGERVTVGQKEGVVARYLADGFAVDFTR